MHIGPVHKILVSGMIFLAAVLGPVRGQITSAAADKDTLVEYTKRDILDADPLFVFYQTNRVPKPGSLTAALPGGGIYSFEWRKYDPAIPGFDAPFETASGTSSSVSGLQEGGYQVRIFDGSTTDTTLVAWVMLDDLHAETEKKPDGTLPSYKFTCFMVSLSGFVYPDTLVYYDPVYHAVYTRPGKFRFKWTSDNSELNIPGAEIYLNPNISYSPPYKDTWYILTATDDLGMTGVDSVFYESISTKAEFSVEYLDKVLAQTEPETAWNPDLTGDFSKDEGSTDAPLTVRFINKSRNGDTFEFVYLDTLGGIKQSEFFYDTIDVGEFTYETADEWYYPYLVSTNEFGCYDTFNLETPIKVVKSDLLIPNVFSPNGDGANDLWIFKHQSLRTCNITVVDRTGKVVYRQEINDIYAWGGWDGQIRESDRKAPEGQYYFVVEALGYDGQEFKDPTLWEDWSPFKSWTDQYKGNTGGTGGTGTGGTGDEERRLNLYTGWLYLFRQ